MVETTAGNETSGQGTSGHGPSGAERQVSVVRSLGWISIALILAFLINVIITVYFDQPGLGTLFGEGGGIMPVIQLLVYVAAIAVPVLMVVRTPARGLRADAAAMTEITNFIIRACFWAVLLIGLVDAVISFLRVEGFLDAVVGEALSTELGRSRFRGPYVHIPLLALSVLIATRTKTLGFHWLALLVVAAEMLIVIGRFVFSYEQAFQGDLVRFWYGALFLFASAYTLFDDGHVRVDVVYAGFPERRKGIVNAIGAVLLGLSLCWTVLIFGMGDKSSIVNSALLTYEVSQSGFGMYVKYWMASFLGVFAVTMAVQFSSTFVEGFADWRDDPGKREVTPAGGH